MKKICPLLYQQYLANKELHNMSDAECLRDDCAWFASEAGICGVVVLAVMKSEAVIRSRAEDN